MEIESHLFKIQGESETHISANYETRKAIKKAVTGFDISNLNEGLQAKFEESLVNRRLKIVSAVIFAGTYFAIRGAMKDQTFEGAANLGMALAGVPIISLFIDAKSEESAQKSAEKALTKDFKAFRRSERF